MVMPYQVPKPPEATKFQLVSPRGAKLATRVWSPSNNKKPCALCVIVHGGGWHSGYFEELALRLNKENIFCAAYDQVCHGYSQPEPGAPAGCIHVSEFSDLVEDIFAAVEWGKKEANIKDSDSTPVFLLGESFGGLQVLAAGLEAQEYGVKLSGIIALASLIKIGPSMLPPKPVIKILSWLAPYYSKMKMPATDMSVTYNEAFGDPQWAASTRTDPAVRVSPQFTLGGAICTLTTGEAIASRAREFKIPLLAIHGKYDCRTDFEAVHMFVDQAGGEAEGYWVEDTTGHQLLQDRREVTLRVMDKIADWIIQHVNSK